MRYHILFTTLLCVFSFTKTSAQPGFCGAGYSTFYSANIFFANTLNPTLDGEILPFGSHIIAVFRDNDNWKCAGFAQWNGNSLSIVVNGDDGNLPGYQTNEPYKFIVQLPDGCLIDSVAVAYDISGIYTNAGTFLDGTFARFSSFHAVSWPWVTLDATDGLCGESTAEMQVSASLLDLPARFSWGGGDTTATISGLPDGIYTVTVTNAYGCSIVMQDSVFSIPALGVQLNTEYLPATVSCQSMASVTGGTLPVSYLWSTGQTDATATLLPDGDFSVTATDNNGCTAVQSDNCMVSAVSAIQESPNFSIMPNPVYGTENLIIEFSENLSGTLVIRDRTGQEKLITSFTGESLILSTAIQDFSAGLYWIEIKAGSKTFSRKLVVIK